MFTRDSRPPRIDTLIGKAAHVQGDIEFEGGLHLDGHIAGNVRAVRSGEAQRVHTLDQRERLGRRRGAGAATSMLDGHRQGRYPRPRARGARGHRPGRGKRLLRRH